MRCTRCDRIAVPQAVGRTPEDVLVFGWCLDCLAEEDCALEGTLPRRRAADSRGRMPGPKARGRIALLGIAGLLAAWALILALLGLAGRPGPSWGDGRPIDGGSGRFFLAGGLGMALVSLGAWLAAVGPGARLRIGLRVVRSAAAVVGLVALGWGLARPLDRNGLAMAGMATVALGVAWVAYLVERRHVRPGRPTTPQAA